MLPNGFGQSFSPLLPTWTSGADAGGPQPKLARWGGAGSARLHMPPEFRTGRFAMVSVNSTIPMHCHPIDSGYAALGGVRERKHNRD